MEVAVATGAEDRLLRDPLDPLLAAGRVRRTLTAVPTVQGEGDTSH